MPRKNVTPERMDTIRELRAWGVRWRDIATSVGVSMSTISAALDPHGRRLDKKRRSPAVRPRADVAPVAKVEPLAERKRVRDEPRRETVEEYLARGGTITICPSPCNLHTTLASADPPVPYADAFFHFKVHRKHRARRLMEIVVRNQAGSRG